VPNALRCSGRPNVFVKTRPSSPALKRARCALSAAVTTAGIGTVRKPAWLWSETWGAVGDAAELTIDAYLTAEEVDPVGGEPEAFALAQPHAGIEDDQRPISLGHRRRESFDLLDAQWDEFGSVLLRELHVDTR
jgi:hypothetical protein